MDTPLRIVNTGSIVLLKDFQPQNRIAFYGDGDKLVGEFDFSRSPVTFTGDADASARVFIDAVIRMGLEITPPTP